MKHPVKLFGRIPLNINVSVTYTDDMPTPTTGGYAYGRFRIFIRPKYKDDHGILAHELTHIEQAWRNPWHGLCYKFSKSYRLKSEVEAYRVQAKFSPYDVELFAGFIANDYGLPVSADQALELLRKE